MRKKINQIVAMILAFALLIGSVFGISHNQIAFAAETDGITIHFKTDWGGADIFYWNLQKKYNNPTRWTGDTMKPEGDGWYVYTFEDAKTVDFMINYQGNQTTHFTKETGEYWYAGNTWYDYKPGVAEITPTATPKPTNTPKPTETVAPTQAVTNVPTLAATNTPKPTESIAEAWKPIRAEVPTQGPEVTIKPSTDTITVYCKSSTDTVNVYYWNVNSGKNTPVAWPGAAMEKVTDGWFAYTIPGATSARIVFTTDTTETDEFYIRTGENWYVNGSVYTDADDVPNRPIITMAPIATVTPIPTQAEATATPVPTQAQATATPEPTQAQATATPVPTQAEATATPVPTQAEATATPAPTQAEATATPVPTKAPVKGKMILHFYNEKNWSTPSIHYWSAVGGTTASTTWPGEALTAEENNWYVITLEGITSANLLFVDGANANDSNKTADTAQKEGEWWYKGGKWTDIDPNGPTPTPGPTSTPRPTSTPKPTWDPSKPTPTPQPGAQRGEDWDFRDETIYFVMTTRFYDGDSSNNVHTWRDTSTGGPNAENDPGWRGDFQGLIDKLDYIKALGFTALWITPVVKNASNYDHHGYHAINHSVVDVRYESEGATYQDLIDACHEKDIKIIQDIVLNHSSEYGEENLYPIYTRSDNLADLASETTAMTLTDFGRSKGIVDDLLSPQVGESRMNAMKTDEKDTERIYHHVKQIQWEGYSVQTAQMGANCVDLNTENPVVTDYLKDCYVDYINMGVDAFRIDTVKHVARLSFNNAFLPYFSEAGGEDFFMYGEACVLRNEIWNADLPGISVPFYTWKESGNYAWRSDKTLEATLSNEALVEKHFSDQKVSDQPTSDNAFLHGNEYHEPDYSQFSGMGMIDFYMHHQFGNAGSAYGTALSEDKFFNDSTWNVTYVDSHDYGPNNDGGLFLRYSGGTQAWAENLNLMFTFRGIPCIYYGSEIEFKAGKKIDDYGSALENSGRAYFGDNIEGDVTATGFGDYTGASGAVADTLNYPLVKHIRRLNKIRAAIPALRKGQYSTEGVSGNMAYKRRYTNASAGIDSFVCVAITNGATFSGIPNGTYVDAVSGDVQVVNGGTLTVGESGKGNMRVYVLDTGSSSIDGAIGAEIDGPYLK